MQAIALDRPLLAAFYGIPMSLLGESPLTWQLAAIFARWLFTLSVYGFLKALWPEKTKYLKLIILLVLVFPGFKQQWISVIYTHVFLVFAVYFFSLHLFIKSIQSRNRFSFNLVFSILLAVISMTAVEYVAGLELLRPFIIYKLLSTDKSNSVKSRLRQTLRLWVPYLLPFLAFLYYRVFIASSVLYKVQQIDSLNTNPGTTLLNMLGQQFMNIYTSTISVWAQIWEPLSTFDPSSLISKLYLVLFILLFAGTLFFVTRIKLVKDSEQGWLRELAFGGILSLLAAGLPFWAANLIPSINFPNDRILLPFMAGSSILIFALIYFLSIRNSIFRILFSLVFSFAAVFQVYQANLFRNDWENFEQFFQQLSWRIPSLPENTLLVTDELPLSYYSDNSLTAVFNWIYADSPDWQSDAETKSSMPYLINYTESRLGHSLSSLEPGTKINHNYRIYTFKGSTDQMILFYHQPPGCLHLVDPDLDSYNPLLPSILREFAMNSRNDLIQEDVKQNDIFFLSGVAGHSWCYFYEKASLAADLGKWEEVVQLGASAFTLADHPNDASERIPFIEGYARTGDWISALQLSHETAQVSDLYQPMLCHLWQILDEETESSSQKTTAMRQISIELGCELEGTKSE